ncbi:decaprenyl-phosphate phosphoribosyltransferase [Fundidesulfovibrio butyratiphilus]
MNRTALSGLVKMARPHQYLKNLFVFLPAFFGWKLTDPHALFGALLAFLAFCLAAGAVYVFNDLRDVEQDRQHPIKRLRPLPAGTVTPGQAWRFAGLLLVGSLLVTPLVPGKSFPLILGAYLAVNLAYSLGVKHMAIVDLMCIAIGFVLRVFAGGAASGVTPSHWIVIMTFLLALFLGLAKRRDDLLLPGGDKVRKSLDGYSLEFVSLCMAVMAGVVIVSYILYTLSPDVIAKHGTDRLYLTGLWVVAAMLRYMQIALVEGRSGSPTQVLLRDGFIKWCIGLWVVSVYLILYWK